MLRSYWAEKYLSNWVASLKYVDCDQACQRNIGLYLESSRYKWRWAWEFDYCYQREDGIVWRKIEARGREHAIESMLRNIGIKLTIKWWAITIKNIKRKRARPNFRMLQLLQTIILSLKTPLFSIHRIPDLKVKPSKFKGYLGFLAIPIKYYNTSE